MGLFSASLSSRDRLPAPGYPFPQSSLFGQGGGKMTAQHSDNLNMKDEITDAFLHIE